jgi:hypothetical protein
MHLINLLSDFCTTWDGFAKVMGVIVTFTFLFRHPVRGVKQLIKTVLVKSNLVEETSTQEEIKIKDGTKEVTLKGVDTGDHFRYELGTKVYVVQCFEKSDV